MLQNFMSKDEININEDEWRSLMSKYSKEEIISALSDAISKLPFPYEKISLESCIADFANLESLNGKSLIMQGKWTTRYDYKYELSDIFIRSNNTGRDSSNYFFNALRMNVDSINSPSAIRSWENEKFRKGFLNAIFSLKYKQINSKTLLSAISLRKYIPSQFRPSVAKAVYDYFGAETILDFSSGWGDRAVASLGKKQYVGCDPNTSLVAPFEEMLKTHPHSTEVKMYWEPFEDVLLKEKDFDLCFTSPPYFKIEKYSKENTQSYLRYKKFDDWMEQFLFVSVAKAYEAIRSNGILAINISDVYCDHRLNKICDSMNDYIGSLGAIYKGAIGMQMGKRPNSKADQVGIFCEPIWVWQKPR